MKKHIAEELPARKFPQASLSKPSDKKDGKEDKGSVGGQGKSSEERVSQAASDIRYRSRRENIPLRQAYSQYIQNSSLSEQEKSLVREKLFGKGGIVKETYLTDVSGLASESVAKALYSVFVEKKIEDIDYDQLKNDLEEAAHLNKYNSGDKKYKVRVTDKNGVTYVRFASRQKINDLRSNPNIEAVEMTEYGEPYEGEKKKGEQTAKSKAGKDYDGDGKVESGAKEHAGAVHNAIQRKRGGVPDGKDTSNVKEEFLGEVKKNTDTNKKYDVMKGKNQVKVCPTDSSNVNENAYSKFLQIINEKTLTKAEKSKKEEIVNKLKPKYGKTSKTYAIATSVAKKVAEESECGMEKKKKDGEEDSRSIETKVNLVKNKLRSMGLKMDYEPEGEVLDELRRSEKMGKGSPESPRSSFPSRAIKKERGERGGRHHYSGSVEFGGNRSERGKKKNEPGSQHQRLNPPEKKGRQLERGSAAAMQRWHSARD